HRVPFPRRRIDRRSPRNVHRNGPQRRSEMTGTAAGIAVGTIAEPRTFGPLTRQMFVRYSGASGDLNPMHYDDTLARAAGNPSVFSQGMHQAALLATFATDW